MDMRFRKPERLRYKSLVEPLFEDGKSMFEYPLRMVYRPVSDSQLKEAFRIAVPDDIAPLQVLVSVPKKKRRHAVDRVLMRRRIREAWRLQRHLLRDAVKANPHLSTLSVAIVYAADVNIEYPRIHAKVGKLIGKLIALITEQ